MRKTVVIHQPDFLPYLGFFHRLLYADQFVALDHVQFNRSWTHRDKIKTPRGVEWVTISVKKTSRDTPTNRVEISRDIDWKSANLNLIRANYESAPFFSEIFPLVEELYRFEGDMMADFTWKSIELLMKLFDISIPIVFSSRLETAGRKNELLIDILKKVGATRYLSGPGSKAYLDEKLFQENHIEVLWQQFEHPVYPQIHGEFIPNLSSLDLLFNCGILDSQRRLRTC